MTYQYSTAINEKCAKGVGLALPISKKHSEMVCKAIKGMQVAKAKKYLENVIALKQPVAFTRHNRHTAHQPGIGPGQYPAKACEHILAILKSVESNAQWKGLSTLNLVIKHASAQKGPGAPRFGRRRTMGKRTHVEFVVEERKGEQK